MRYVVDDSYLHQRNGVWWYNRRVPKKYAHLDTRSRIRKSLETRSVDTARILRDQLVEADNDYWLALALSEDSGDASTKQQIDAAAARYRAAQSRAIAAGFPYKPITALANEQRLDDVLERLLEVRDRSGQAEEPKKRDAEALLGGAAKPKITVSTALELYIRDIAHDAQIYKSARQRYSWEKTKRTSISYFIEQAGDLPLDEITRDHALRYQSWWAAKISPKDKSTKPITANTANRHIGNIRSLYGDYYRHIGEENRQNPFRNMHFKARVKKEVPPFTDEWVRERILKPGALSGLRPELQLIVYMLIETGCRPSEIINLQADDIHLDEDIPFISIRSRSHGSKKREVKTSTSERDLPLVGVALEAARRARTAFPHYQDRSELFSANMMKSFRNRRLFPSQDHKIYSFRHSFESRMQEANIDYALRCLLMGHKNTRPSYGDGGSMEYRRDELLKIVHPFDREIFTAFDVEHAEWALVT